MDWVDLSEVKSHTSLVEAAWTGSTVMYPSPKEMMFWKKCDPCETGTCSSSAVSTMKADWSMSCQPTGMPVAASLEPQRPGAINKYLRPSECILAFTAAISSAMACVWSLAKASGDT